MRKRDYRALGSQGMVSMTITMVIMIIVTLLVSSYALIVRREQRNVLDRQLSSQAFYSAESGLEDARAAIMSGLLDRDITECIDAGSGNNAFVEYMNSVKGAQYDSKIYSNVAYTCLLVDRSPESLAYTVSPGQGGILVPISAPNIDKLRISWQNQNGDDDFESSPSFSLPANNGTLSAPMLRVTILPGFSGGTLNSARLINESHTLFLYPNGGSAPAETIGYLGGSGGPNSTSTQQGRFVNGNCRPGNTPKHCAVEISNLNISPPAGQNEEYFLAIQPLYKAADIEIEGFIGANTVVELSKAQALVDVTGKAEDVLRRVQARLPIGIGSELKGMNGIFPGAALETSDEICKLLEYQGGASFTNGCNP